MINSIHGIISKTQSLITPPEGLVILKDWILIRMAIENENDFYPLSADARAHHLSYIPAGGVGEVRGKSKITIFGLDREVYPDAYTSFDYCVWRSPKGVVGTYNNNFGFESEIFVAENTFERVRTDGSWVHFEYLLPNGNWMPIQQPVPQLQEKLYPKISTDPGEMVLSLYVSGMISE